MVLSRDGALLGLAARLERPLYIHSKAYAPRGFGIVERPLKAPDKLPEGSIGEPCLAKFTEKRGEVWGGGLWASIVTENPTYSVSLGKLAGVQPQAQEVGGLFDGEKLYCIHKVDRYFEPVVGLCCVWVEASESDELRRLIPTLQKAGYKGPVYFKERLKAGMDLPVLAALCELLPDGPVGLMDAEGEFWRQKAVGVRAWIPPFPMLGDARPQKLEAQEGRDKHLWYIDKGNESVGVVDGNVGWMTARGGTKAEALRRIDRTIANLPLIGLSFKHP